MVANQSMFNKQSSRYKDPRSSIIIIFNMSSLSNVYIGSKWFSNRNHPNPIPVPSKPIIALKDVKFIRGYQSSINYFIFYLNQISFLDISFQVIPFSLQMYMESLSLIYQSFDLFKPFLNLGIILNHFLLYLGKSFQIIRLISIKDFLHLSYNF